MNRRKTITKLRRANRSVTTVTRFYNGTSSIAFSSPASGSLGASPPVLMELTESTPLDRVPLPPVDSSKFLKRIGSIFPEVITSPVNTVRFATRRVMRYEAMAYSPPRLDDCAVRLREKELHDAIRT